MTVTFTDFLAPTPVPAASGAAAPLGGLQHLVHAVLLGSALLALAACGGDPRAVSDAAGGANPAPGVVAPALPADPAPDEVASQAPGAPELALQVQQTKTFAFGWQAVPGATSYRLLEDPSGSAGYTEVAQLDGSATAHDLSVFLPGRINARYMLQACNVAGCSDSASVPVGSPQVLTQAVGYVKASNTDDHWGAEFGWSVALSSDGSTLAVGAPYEGSMSPGVNADQTNALDRTVGAVYVFVRESGHWTQQAYIKPSVVLPGQDPYFGSAVSLSANGDTLAVGAWQQGDPLPYSGTAYVFVREEGAWREQARILPERAWNDGYFGSSVVLSADGSTLAIGHPGDRSNATGVNGDRNNQAAYGSGAVHIYVRSGDTWAEQAYLKPSFASFTGGVYLGWNGLAMSADGNTVVAGAAWDNSNATGVNGNGANALANDSGAVYVFTRAGSTWSHDAYIKASNTGSGDNFGYAVAVSADGLTLAVGAPGEDSAAIGIGGEQASNAAANSGAVYVFSRASGSWVQQAYIKASNTRSHAQFGLALALSADGSLLAVGSERETSAATGINGDQSSTAATHAGAVYLFGRSNGQWSQHAYLKAPNTRGNSYFGSSVALSGNGRLLAVGAPGESSAAIGINGNQSDTTAPNAGAVFLY